MSTGTPSTIRQSRRGRWRVVTDPEKNCLFMTECTKICTATLTVHLVLFANKILTE